MLYRGPVMGVPARRYSWEPFQPGHTVSLRHGAYSPRRVDPLAAEYAALIEPESYLADPSYAPAVWAWARAEARCTLLAEYLADRDLLDAKGRPLPAMELVIRMERLAAEARARLGLDPLARARLGKDITSQSVDLARLYAERRAGEAPAGAHDAPDAEEAPDGTT